MTMAEDTRHDTIMRSFNVTGYLSHALHEILMEKSEATKEAYREVQKTSHPLDQEAWHKASLEEKAFQILYSFITLDSAAAKEFRTYVQENIERTRKEYPSILDLVYGKP